MSTPVIDHGGEVGEQLKGGGAPRLACALARPANAAPKAAQQPGKTPQTAKAPQKAGKPAGAPRPDAARNDQNRHDRRPAPHAVSHGNHGGNGSGKQAPRAAGTPGGNTPLRRKPSAA